MKHLKVSQRANNIVLIFLEGLKGKTGGKARNTKAVYCGTLNQRFDTIKQCAEALGVKYGVARAAAVGEIKKNNIQNIFNMIKFLEIRIYRQAMGNH